MENIHIKVRGKHLSLRNAAVVCGNSDYQIVWELDSDWTQKTSKTMRVSFPDGTYQDVLFSGSEVALPPVPIPGWVSVGLYADGMQTEPADIRALPSIVSAAGSPREPSKDVYAQLLDQLDSKMAEPDEDGTAGQVLTTDGLGGRIWRTPSSEAVSVTQEAITDALGYTPVSQSELTGALDSTPTYVKSAADAVIARMLPHVHGGTFSFALFTDLHYAPYFNETKPSAHPISYKQTAEHIVAAINRVGRSVPLACVLSLGDNLESADNADKISSESLATPTLRGERSRHLQMNKASELRGILSGLQPPYIPQKGNHDDGSLAAYYAESDHTYYTSYLMQDSDYYARYFANSGTQNIVHMDAAGNILASYLDVPSCKVRLISLNCIDLPYTSEADGSCPYLGAPYAQYLAGQHCYGYSEGQLRWLAETALQLPDAGWQVMLFQHIPMLSSFSKQDGAVSDYQRFNYDVLEGILHAYQKGSRYTCSLSAGKAPNGAESSRFACSLSADFTAQGQCGVAAIWCGHIHRDLQQKTTMPTKPAGTTIRTPDFTNVFNASDSTFLSNQRYSASASNKLASANGKGSLSNVIAAAKGDTIRIHFGASMSAYAWPVMLQCSADGTPSAAGIYAADGSDSKIIWNDDKTEATITNPYSAQYYRFAVPQDTADVVITVNQEITYSEVPDANGGEPILFVSTMLACPNYSDGGSAWNGTHYPHTANSAEETSVDFVTVDTENRKIYTVRYGAGADREMAY